MTKLSDRIMSHTIKSYTHIYIDESGETGKSSKYIVFAAVATNSDRALEKLIKKIWRVKPQLHSRGELHANSADDATKRRVLLTLNTADASFYFSILEKSALTEPATHAYYRELGRFIGIFHRSQIIIVDKKDTDQKRAKTLLALNIADQFNNVRFKESHKTKQLQAADFVAWAIGREMELGDSSFSDLIQKKKKI